MPRSAGRHCIPPAVGPGARCSWLLLLGARPRAVRQGLASHDIGFRHTSKRRGRSWLLPPKNHTKVMTVPTLDRQHCVALVHPLTGEFHDLFREEMAAGPAGPGEPAVD